MMEERLKQLREALRMNQSEFAQKINIGQSTLGMMEVGKRTINDRHIQLICLQFNVNEHWLRTGEGEMFLQTTEDKLEALAQKYGFDELDKMIFSGYMDLNREQRELIRSLILNISIAHKKQKGLSQGETDTILTMAHGYSSDIPKQNI